MRHGGICYLDEVVEARKDVTVVLHPLTDDRRILPLDRTGEMLHAPPDFMLVISYNPGYQSDEVAEAEHAPAFCRARIRLPAGGGGSRDRRRRKRPAGAAMPAARFCSPIVCARSPTSISRRVARPASSSMRRGLIAGGMRVEDAVRAAMIEPLTDDIETRRGLVELMRVTLG